MAYYHKGGMGHHHRLNRINPNEWQPKIRHHDNKYTGSYSLRNFKFTLKNNSQLGITLHGWDGNRINRIKVVDPNYNPYNIRDGSKLIKISYHNTEPPKEVIITADNLSYEFKKFMTKKNSISETDPETYITLMVESEIPEEAPEEAPKEAPEGAEGAEGAAPAAPAPPLEGAPEGAPKGAAPPPPEQVGSKSYKTKRHRKNFKRNKKSTHRKTKRYRKKSKRIKKTYRRKY